MRINPVLLTVFLSALVIAGLLWYYVDPGNFTKIANISELLTILSVITTIIAFLTASYFVVLAVNAYSEVREISKLHSEIILRYDEVRAQLRSEEEQVVLLKKQLESHVASIVRHFSGISTIFSGQASNERQQDAIHREIARLKFEIASNFSDKLRSIYTIISLNDGKDDSLIEKFLMENYEIEDAKALLVQHNEGKRRRSTGNDQK